MLNQREPTSKEVSWASLFRATADLMEKDLEHRYQSAQAASDLMVRYAQLKTLLDDRLIADHQKLTYKNLTMIRKYRRSQYSHLLSNLKKDIDATRREFLANRDTRRDWAGTGFLQDNAWMMQSVLLEFRLALILHGMYFPCSTLVANHAYEYLRRCFPPAPVVPIRV